MYKMNEVIIKDCNVEIITKVNDSIMSFIITSLQEKYPECIDWFKNKVLPELHTDKRKLFLLYSNNILIGFSITKKKSKKKIKICSLFIKPEYRNKGYGTILLKFVMNYYKNNSFYLSFRCQSFIEKCYNNNFITKFGFTCKKEHPVNNRMFDIFYEI